MGKERVVKLLRSHRVRIARALVRQARSLAPRYEQIDALAQERSFVGLVFALERVFEDDDDSMLAEQTEQLAMMRVAVGFQMEDFLLASLGWLPVIRTFLVEHGTNLAESLADYEVFEAVAIPLVARAATAFVEAGEDPTQPNAKRPRISTSSLKRLRSLPVERVSGSDDEEDEPTYRNFTPFTSSTT
jgi:hypothetical protein